MTQQQAAPVCQYVLRGGEEPCGLGAAVHEGPCPVCGGSGEYETEYGPRGCACVSGDHPLGHDFINAESAHA